MSNEDYDVVVLRPEDFEEVVVFLNKHFTPREPLCYGLHIDDYRVGEGRIGEAVRAALTCRVSCGARMKTSGELVGVILSIIEKRGKCDLKPGLELVKVQEDINILLEMVMEGVDKFGNKDKVLDNFIMTVADEHARKGVGIALAKKSALLGIAAGCERALTLTTNRSTMSMSKKLGFKMANVLDLKNLGPTYKGEPLDIHRIESVNGHTTIYAMISDISAVDDRHQTINILTSPGTPGSFR